MKRLRLELDVKGDGFVVKLSAPDDNWAARERTLRRGTPMGFPMPPLDENASWDDKYADLCSATDDKQLRRLHLRILQRDSADDDVDRFGSYLFAVLFGLSWNWATTQFPTELGFDIEILSSAEAKLDFVPWEMMAMGGKPLIAQAQHSISRVILPRKKIDASELKLPLRVLFIVGAMDDLLRPGAEYLGFLGNGSARSTNGAQGATAATPMLMVRSLANADAQQLQTAVDRFEPHIVHVVAHGMLDDDYPAIQLARSNAAGEIEADPCRPEKLLELLRGSKRNMPLPTVVVVNACHTADQADVGDARSFAASLVRGGVAAAVGMAGEAASSACRLFTRALYAALSRKSCLAQAVAEAQQAARLHYQKYGRSGDWARPSLFIAQGAHIEFEESEQTLKLLKAIASLRGTPDVLCDRYTAMRAYETFIANQSDDAKRILVYEQEAKGPQLDGNAKRAQLGSSHLLYELRWRALLDGYLTCHVPSDRGTPPAVLPPPHNLLLLAIRLAEIMDEQRETFGLEPLVTSAAHSTAFITLGLADVAPAPEVAFRAAMGKVKKELESRTGIGADDLKMVEAALRNDIERFLADVKGVCGSLRGVLILLDDLDRYVGYFQYVLQLAVGQFGLGTRKARAPLVCTYAAYNGAGEDLRAALNSKAYFSHAERVSVEPFPNAPEGRLAYGHYLLSKGLAFSRDRSKQGTIETLLDLIHENAKGVPSFFTEAAPVLKIGLKHGAIVEVDDEAIFAALHDIGHGGAQ